MSEVLRSDAAKLTQDRSSDVAKRVARARVSWTRVEVFGAILERRCEARTPRGMESNSPKVKVLYVMFCTKPGCIAEIPSICLTSTARAKVEGVVVSKRERRTEVMDFQMKALRASSVDMNGDPGGQVCVAFDLRVSREDLLKEK
jgi:hypothetical protein